MGRVTARVTPAPLAAFIALVALLVLGPAAAGSPAAAHGATLVVNTPNGSERGTAAAHPSLAYAQGTATNRAYAARGAATVQPGDNRTPVRVWHATGHGAGGWLLPLLPETGWHPRSTPGHLPATARPGTLVTPYTVGTYLGRAPPATTTA